MSEPTTTPGGTTALILAAMDDLGPADARTISEHAQVGYSTAVRKLREWTVSGEIAKIDRGSEPAHYALLPADQPLPAHLQPTGDVAPATEDVADPDDATGGTEAPQHTGQDDDQLDAGQEPDGESADATEQPDTLPEAEATDGGTAKAEDTEPEADTASARGTDQQPQPEAQNTPECNADPGSADDQVQELPEPGADPSQPVAEAQSAAPEEEADADPGAATNGSRRPKNYLHDEGLRLLRLHPDRALKVGEMAKLIAAQEIAAGAPAGTKVSTGALSNALHKAAAAGEAILTCEKPATFQAA